MTHVAYEIVFIDPAVINIITIYYNIVCTAHDTSQPASQTNLFAFVWKRYFIRFRSFLFYLARRILFIRIWVPCVHCTTDTLDRQQQQKPDLGPIITNSISMCVRACLCYTRFVCFLFEMYIFSEPNWNRSIRQTGRACKVIK